MSLRIWTVAIAVGGLALYTLSLLPDAKSAPEPLVIPKSSEQQLAVPGTQVYPLIYRDPALINFTPGPELLWPEPYNTPIRSRPRPDSFDSCRRHNHIQSNHPQEVLS